VFAFGPEAQANAGGGAAGATGALVGAGASDFFDEQSVDAALWVVPGDSSETGINHEPDAVNRQRSFGDVGGDDDFGLRITGDGGVLVVRWQIAVEREDDEPAAVSVANGLDGATDFIGAGHENQGVAFEAPVEFFGGDVPDWHVSGGTRKIFDVHREGAALRFEDDARRKIFFDAGDVERGGHDDDEQIGSGSFLDLQGASESDVAVEVAFVKFVKENGGDAGEFGVVEHLPEDDAFGDVPDSGLRRGDIVEPDLVTDFLADFAAARLCDPTGEHSRREATRLEDDDFAGAELVAVEEKLGNLSGLTGAGGRGEDEPFALAGGGEKAGANFVNG